MAFSRAKINEHVFDEPMTPEALYWTGMLLADGCVSFKYGRYGKTYQQIILSLAEKDRAHVEKFKQFLQCDYSIIYSAREGNFGSNPVATISVASDRLANRLFELGVVPRKTKIAAVKPRLQEEVDFWRGVVDGDGSLGFATNRGLTYPTIALGGTRMVVGSFQQFLSKHILELPRIGACRSIYRCGLNGIPARRAVELLYSEATVYLDRKMEIAKKIMEWKSKREAQRLVTLQSGHGQFHGVL